MALISNRAQGERVMSSASCEKCNREITDENDILKAVKNFDNARCKMCKEKLTITVSAKDIMFMPEPHRTEALCVMTE